MRGVNVIRDAPNVQFYVDGTAVSTADYGAAADYKPAHTGTRAIKLAIKAPPDLSGTDPGYTDIGSSESHDFQGPTDYTVVATGTVTAPQMLVMTGTLRDTVADNTVSYQVINAAQGAGSIQIFVTAPEAGIASPQQVGGTLALGQYTDNTTLNVAAAAGASDTATRAVNITLEARDAASGATIYRSSALSVNEQTRLLFVVADNVGPAGASPLKIFAISGTSSATAATMFDPDDAGELSFANTSPDSGPLDLIVGSSASSLLASNVAFAGASPYVPVTESLINAIATPAGNPGTFLFVNNFSNSPDRSFTIYAQDRLASIRGVVITDDRRSVPTEAHVRFLHAAPSEGGGGIDVYVRPPGSSFDLNASTPPTASVAALPYRSVSAQLILKAGSYDVYVARAGAKTTVLGPTTLTVVAGGVQTQVLGDLPAGGLSWLPFNNAR